MSAFKRELFFVLANALAKVTPQLLALASGIFFSVDQQELFLRVWSTANLIASFISIGVLQQILTSDETADERETRRKSFYGFVLVIGAVNATWIAFDGPLIATLSLSFGNIIVVFLAMRARKSMEQQVYLAGLASLFPSLLYVALFLFLVLWPFSISMLSLAIAVFTVAVSIYMISPGWSKISLNTFKSIWPNFYLLIGNVTLNYTVVFSLSEAARLKDVDYALQLLTFNVALGLLFFPGVLSVRIIPFVRTKVVQFDRFCDRMIIVSLGLLFLFFVTLCYAGKFFSDVELIDYTSESGWLVLVGFGLRSVTGVLTDKFYALRMFKQLAISYLILAVSLFALSKAGYWEESILISAILSFLYVVIYDRFFVRPKQS